MIELPARSGRASARVRRPGKATTVAIDPINRVDIFDKFDLLRQIESLQAREPDLIDARPQPEPDLPAEDRLRFKVLRDILEDPRGSKRPVIVGTQAMADAVARLKTEAPNFANYIDIVHGAVALSQTTKTSLRLPPTLMVGSPGIGKSRLLRKLSRVLATRVVSIDMPVVDAFQFAGQNPAYKGARVGLVAEALLAGSAQPLLVLEEFDKPNTLASRDQSPHGIFHSLLEEESAAAFKDEYLGMKLDCCSILWAASANNTTGIPPSILSRMLVLEIPSPNSADRQMIIDRIIAEELAMYGERFTVAKGEVEEIKRLFESLSPRSIRRATHLAITFTAGEGSCMVHARNILRARELLAARNTRSVGFFTNLS